MRFQNPHPNMTQQPVMGQQPQMVMVPTVQQVQPQLMQLQNGQMAYVDPMSGNIVGYPTQVQQPMQGNMVQPMQQPMMMSGQRPSPMMGARFNAGQMANNTMQQPMQGNMVAVQQMAPEPQMSNNRYGNIQQLVNNTQQPVQQQFNKEIEMQPPAKQAPPVVQVPVVQEPESINLGITDSRVKLEVRAIEFKASEVFEDTDQSTLYGDSVEEVLSATMKLAASCTDSGKTVFTHSAMVLEKYYGVTLGDRESRLFSIDVDTAYRNLKSMGPDINKKSELGFFNGYNRWITEVINDYLLLVTKGEFGIDNFYEDFNALVGIMESKKELLNGLNDTVNDMLEQACLDIEAIRSVTKDDAGEVVTEALIPEDTAVLPRRYEIVYLKLMGYEIGDTGTKEGEKASSKLLSSLKSFVSNEVVYLCTMDRCIYKVFFIPEGSVILERLS